MKLSKKTLWLGVPVIVLWAIATAALVDRARGPRTVASFDSGDRLTEPRESWLALYAGREADAPRIGSIRLRQAPETRGDAPGARFDLDVEMTLELFGRSAGLDLSGHAWRPYREPRAEIEFAVRSGESDFRLAGEIRDDRLRATVTSAGESIPLELPVGEGALFSGGFGSAFHFPRLEIGDEVGVDTFDPMTLRASKAIVRAIGDETIVIGGESHEARILRVDAQGMRTRAWVDQEGEVLRAETALGLTIERATPEELEKPVPAGDSFAAATDLLSLTAIRPTGPRPFRGASAMAVELRGSLPQDGLPLDRSQRRLGAEGERRYRIEPGAAAADHDTSAPGPDDSHLGADAFVQSDHPRIVAATREILDAAGLDRADADVTAKANALHDWVFAALDKEPVLSIPSALEVLEQRRGDCNEHAVLYTALARAAGLETRIAIGIVWSELLGGFYYHAWPEVWVGSHWLWLDPTLGQPLADATHLKLLNGGIESWPQLLPYLGRLQIEVLEIR